MNKSKPSPVGKVPNVEELALMMGCRVGNVCQLLELAFVGSFQDINHLGCARGEVFQKRQWLSKGGRGRLILCNPCFLRHFQVASKATCVRKEQQE
ncbi:hypothetical protein AAG906_015716 [Vitis piasezkii]